MEGIGIKEILTVTITLFTVIDIIGVLPLLIDISKNSGEIHPERASIENKELEGLSQRQIVFRRFVRHRAAMVAIIYLMLILMFVFSALDLKFGPCKEIFSLITYMSDNL